MNFLIAWFLFPFFLQDFDWIRFDMIQRSNFQGKTTTINSTAYFTQGSDLVIHQTFPMDLFVFNNRDGELKIYNPNENSVYQTVNYDLNSETNQFYFFFMNQTGDMGLRNLGFRLKNSSLEDGHLVSEYESDGEFKKYFKKVKLVHKRKDPVFLGYMNEDDEYLKKVYYYDYEDVYGMNFPKAITEITYLENRDSVISKTEFINFTINNPLDKEIIDFKIPESAELIK